YLEEVAPEVAVAGVAGGVQHPLDLLRDVRDVGDRGGVGAGGEQAEEPSLPGDGAGVVEDLDPDVVEVERPVDGGARVGLGDDEQPWLGGLLRDAAGEHGGPRRVCAGPVLPQDRS